MQHHFPVLNTLLKHLSNLMAKVKPLVKISSGTVTTLRVWDTNSQKVIGYGWVFMCEHGGMDPPTLIDEKGNKLPEGWFTLEAIDKFLAAKGHGIH